MIVVSDLNGKNFLLKKLSALISKYRRLCSLPRKFLATPPLHVQARGANSYGLDLNLIGLLSGFSQVYPNFIKIQKKTILIVLMIVFLFGSPTDNQLVRDGFFLLIRYYLHVCRRSKDLKYFWFC